MRTPASISGHPIHPMLVPIAIGGFVLSLVFDIICLAKGATTPWSTVAYYTMIGGVVGALCAAVFGLVDVRGRHRRRRRHHGHHHVAHGKPLAARGSCFRSPGPAQRGALFI